MCGKMTLIVESLKIQLMKMRMRRQYGRHQKLHEGKRKLPLCKQVYGFNGELTESEEIEF